MNETAVLDAMSPPRRSLLLALKLRGSAGIAALREELGVSYEAARLHLAQLESDGFVARRLERGAERPGRPRSLYRLTVAGEHLFPKAYDDLAVELIDAAGERLGPAAVRDLLAEVTRRQVEQWEPLLRNKSLADRLQALQGIYRTDDPFTEVWLDSADAPALVELNCPYLEVAKRRPALCSVTVSVLRRLLGYEVMRTERFQEGHGRCVFSVRTDRPVTDPATFDWEPEPA